MIVGFNGSKFFDFGDPGNSLYFRNNNLLFFLNGSSGRLWFRGKADDQFVFIDLELIE